MKGKEKAAKTYKCVHSGPRGIVLVVAQRKHSNCHDGACDTLIPDCGSRAYPRLWV